MSRWAYFYRKELNEAVYSLEISEADEKFLKDSNVSPEKKQERINRLFNNQGPDVRREYVEDVYDWHAFDAEDFSTIPMETTDE